MKTKSLLFLLIGCYFLMTCEDGFIEAAMPVEMEAVAEEITYPLKFIYAELDFQPTEFYTYQLDSFKQIVIDEGDYTLLDSLIFTDFYDETLEEGLAEPFPFREVELLNDTLVRIRVESELIEMPIDSSFNYYIEDDILIIEFFNGTVEFEHVREMSQIRLCRQVWGFNYYNERRERRDVSPLDGRNCEFDNKTELLERIVEGLGADLNIQKNDTIVVNYSYYNLDLME